MERERERERERYEEKRKKATERNWERINNEQFATITYQFVLTAQ